MRSSSSSSPTRFFPKNEDAPVMATTAPRDLSARRSAIGGAVLAQHGRFVEMQDQAPDRLGPYELVERLATGGMAEVYLAKRAGPHGFSKLVAVKRILPQLARDPDFV